MTQQSLAESAVIVLAEVRAIGETMDNSHPMRHAVRKMKITAERALDDAFRQAFEISYQAKQLVKDHEDAMKEAK